MRTATTVLGLWLVVGTRAIAAPDVPTPSPAPAAAQTSVAADGGPTTAGLQRQLDALKKDLDAQRAATEAALSGSDSPEKEQMLRLYGFADMGLQRITSNGSRIDVIIPSRATTFAVGNINLYIDAQPTDKWSALIETRLTNYPDGADQVGTQTSPYQRVDTTIYDINSTTGGWGTVKYGAIILERAYLQYRYNDVLAVRMGQFLTPFGIWNIDHGTPTLISLALPQAQVIGMYPTHQVGVQILGSTVHGPWELGYYATISNGRTVGQLDLTDDKMTGGRVYAQFRRGWRGTFGLSALAGRFSDQNRVIRTFLPLVVDRTELIAYNEQVAGADVAIDAGNLRLRSEVIHRRVVYDPGKRETVVGAGPGFYVPDHLETNWYGLGAYQLRWWGLEPFLYAEVLRFPQYLGTGVIMFAPGFNIHFNAAAQLKLQYEKFFLYEDLDHLRQGNSAGNDGSIYMLRLVLAF